jgi:hypothetical protein
VRDKPGCNTSTGRCDTASHDLQGVSNRRESEEQRDDGTQCTSTTCRPPHPDVRAHGRAVGGVRLAGAAAGWAERRRWRRRHAPRSTRAAAAPPHSDGGVSARHGLPRTLLGLRGGRAAAALALSMRGPGAIVSPPQGLPPSGFGSHTGGVLLRQVHDNTPPRVLTEDGHAHTDR